MIVADANILLYMVIEGERTEECRSLYKRDPEWVFPMLWKDEVSNVLVTYERHGLLTREESLRAFTQAMDIVDAREYSIPIDFILSVAEKTSCSGYDSQYIALAENLGLKLYTYDKKILKNCPETALMPT